MKIYKVITLGAEFTVSNESDGASGADISLASDSKIAAEYSLRCRKDAFLPDVFRAVSAYLFFVKGLPSSQYDIMHEGKLIPIPVPRKSERLFGGVIGSFSLLSSPEKKAEIPIYDIMTPVGVYRAAVLDSLPPRDFSETGAALMRIPSERAVCSVLALSGKDGRYSVLAHKPGGSPVCSSLFGAAAYLASGLGDLSEKIEVRHGDFCAACRVNPYGVSVFDGEPRTFAVLGT